MSDIKVVVKCNENEIIAVKTDQVPLGTEYYKTYLEGLEKTKGKEALERLKIDWAPREIVYYEGSSWFLCDHYSPAYALREMDRTLVMNRWKRKRSEAIHKESENA